jgi:hypothetical protein
MGCMFGQRDGNSACAGCAALRRRLWIYLGREACRVCVEGWERRPEGEGLVGIAGAYEVILLAL